VIRRFFSPPIFEREEDNFRAKFINAFAWIVSAALTLATIRYLYQPADDLSVPIFLGLIVVMLVALYLLRRGKINASGSVVILLCWVAGGIQGYTADGVKDVIVVAFIAVGLLASIIISWRAGGVILFMSIGTIWALALLESNGYFTPRYQDPIGYATGLSLVFMLITGLVYFSSTSLQDAVKRATQSENNLRISNQSLQELNQTLEARVASRTAELELANQRNEKRAKQFEAIALAARATIANQNRETLLPSLVELISNQFGSYHVGIFLLDENREFAELRAANSEGGQRMLARGHRLGLGKSGIVGNVAATGKPRIALNVADDAAFFNNPDLPDTRSEIALPLRAGDQLIGILDVQSLTPNAFQEEDVGVLLTLADQVALGIQNARSFEITQKLLQEARRTSGALLRESWRVLESQHEGVRGFRVVENKVTPLAAPLASGPINKALTSKQVVRQNGANAALAIPLRLRDEVIGIMDLRVPEEHEWDDDEVDIAEAVAERLSLALESALLLKSAQRRAEMERITTDIAGKIGTSTQIDSILRTAAEELSRALGDSEVLVQLQPDALGRQSEA
jgi:GAF domain-containing protein